MNAPKSDDLGRAIQADKGNCEQCDLIDIIISYLYTLIQLSALLLVLFRL